MRTTIEFPGSLFGKVKAAAFYEGISLKNFIKKAVEHELKGKGSTVKKKQVTLPLIPSKNPGSINLSSEKIASLLFVIN